MPLTVTVFDVATSGTLPESSEAPNSSEKNDHTVPGDQDAFALRMVAKKLAGPTQEMLFFMRRVLWSCNGALMDISGHRASLGPADDVSSDVGRALRMLHGASSTFDHVEDELSGPEGLPFSSLTRPEVAKLLVFSRFIRTAASAIDALGAHVCEMKQKSDQSGVGMHLPSYPLHKAVNYTNAQIRHDRGGATASRWRTRNLRLYLPCLGCSLLL